MIKIKDGGTKIIHTMADGSVRDSIEGYEIPYNETTAIAYDLIVKWAVEKQNNTSHVKFACE